jgi:hypothetical protein
VTSYIVSIPVEVEEGYVRITSIDSINVPSGQKSASETQVIAVRVGADVSGVTAAARAAAVSRKRPSIIRRRASWIVVGDGIVFLHCHDSCLLSRHTSYVDLSIFLLDL